MPATVNDEVHSQCHGMKKDALNPVVFCRVLGNGGARYSTRVWESVSLKGRICANGTYHFRTELSFDLTHPASTAQLAIYGQL